MCIRDRVYTVQRRTTGDHVVCHKAASRIAQLDARVHVILVVFWLCRWSSKAVTGDPSKSLRLHLEEKRSKPFMMRMMDKAAFTVGVSLVATEGQANEGGSRRGRTREVASILLKTNLVRAHNPCSCRAQISCLGTM